MNTATNEVPAGQVDPSVAALYGLALDEFTLARDTLAKQRRAEGDRSAATAIKALRKPGLPAWALNQVARRHPAAVEELLAAGDLVRAASEQALAGDATDLRAASRDLAAAVSDVTDLAVRLLRDAGRAVTTTTTDRITTTVRAAATDRTLGATLAAGLLTGDADPAGFDLTGLSVPVAATRSDPRTQPDAPSTATGPAPAVASGHERERARLEAAIDAHRAKLERAEREVAELEARLAAALDRVDRRQGELEALLAELTTVDRGPG